MKFAQSLLAAFSACAWMTLAGTSAIASVATSNAEPQEVNANGAIYFWDTDGKQCILPVPETSQMYDFTKGDQSCPDDQVATFKLINVPSATLIQFYQLPNCSNQETSNNFFVKLKTVKQPTDWSELPAMHFDEFKKVEVGQLIPKMNIRVEGQFEGSDHSAGDWDELISCVYIERSQPVD